ncbi:MAG: thiamine pyrophosphate-binding protein, partial [Candidatus Binatia bacterium]
MATISAGHAVDEALVQLGVRQVFGLAGSCMIEILDGMYGREELSFITVRHEQAAALMADGFARITGKPGVCMATNGPGATNLVTGVANAKLAQSPVIVITGAVMMKDMFLDSTQEIDQVSLFRPIVKWSVQVRKPERTADVIRE